MSTKTKPAAVKAGEVKKEVKKAAAAPVAGDKKTAKAGEKPASPELEAPAVDLEELEEQEEEAAASSSAQSGNAAALAAATNSSNEMSASFKNFRHHPDMENFYRFIYENDLRHEALAIIDDIMVEKQQKKLIKGAKTQAH